MRSTQRKERRIPKVTGLSHVVLYVNDLDRIAMVVEASPENRGNRSLDLDKSGEEIIAQASGLAPAAVH